MRKFRLFAAMVLAVSTILVACGGESKSAAKEKTQYDATVNEVFTCGSKYSGELLVVNLDVTNNSDSYLDSFSPAYRLEASVDGEVLETSYISDDNPYYVKEKKIASEEAGVSQAAFSLEDIDYDEDSELHLILTSYTIDDYKEVAVLDETISMADVEAKTSESEFEVTVDNVTVTDDGEGTYLLVIDYTFTNNSDEPTSFSWAVEESLFQDGIELKTGYLPYKHPMADEVENNQGTDVKAGASLPIRRVYELISDSNVEIKLTDNISFDGATILDTEIQVDIAEADSEASSDEESIEDEGSEEL